MSNSPEPSAVPGLAALAPEYRFLLCDVWGVVHDGVHAFPEACAALIEFRRQGGVVLLLTNAPRMKPQVLQLFARLGVDVGAYDDIVTSGEATHEYLAARRGVRVHHVGPERDLQIYDGIDVTLTAADEAELVCCTGLFDDESETAADYADRFQHWKALGLPMLCANPDKVVERGSRLVWCAGALAAAYAGIGGETVQVGKPHEPIYRSAMARFAGLAGADFDRRGILAVGDGVETDVTGAHNQGLDVLFVSGGIHVDAFGPRQSPDPARIADFLKRWSVGARAYIPRLVW